MHPAPALRAGPASNMVAQAQAFLSTPGSRGRRVCFLLFAVVLMSLADLDMTLTYATSTGLLEDNPIARVLMQHGSVKAVAAWKLLSIALFTYILWRARHTRTAEIATWLCLVVMIWLTLRWVWYINHAHLLSAYLGQHLSQDHRWVTLAE